MWLVIPADKHGFASRFRVHQYNNVATHRQQALGSPKNRENAIKEDCQGLIDVQVRSNAVLPGTRLSECKRLPLVEDLGPNQRQVGSAAATRFLILKRGYNCMCARLAMSSPNTHAMIHDTENCNHSFRSNCWRSQLQKQEIYTCICLCQTQGLRAEFQS